MSRFKQNTIAKLENAKTQLDSIKRGINNNTINAQSVILIVDKVYKLVEDAQEMRNLDE